MLYYPVMDEASKKSYFAQYYQKNKEKKRLQAVEYRANNLDKVRATKARYRANNREKERNRIAKWHAANPHKSRAYGAKRRAAHKTQELERHAKYREEHKEQILISGRAYRSANREKRSAYDAAYRQARPEETRCRVRRRRAKKLAAEGRHTAAETKAIRIAQGDKCAYCKVPLGGKGHLDHIVALNCGGSNWPRNLQWLCSPCNHHKSDKDPIRYARENGLLL